jgi:HEAT repeat protein
VAVGDLERFGPEDPDVALPALTDRLRDDDPSVRAAAAIGLVRVLHGATQRDVDPSEPRRAAAALLTLVKDPKPEVRAAAAESLWMSAMVTQGTPRAGEVAEALVKHVQAETWDRVNVEILQALARFGPLARGAVPRLQEWERKGTAINAPGMVEAARQAIKALQADR